ncbi:MAG TPA: response regulator [Tepidisphaeraceae bacterium]|jgi:CheY-like chemotaxis protein|nr:response regulator [Tepidisphaeraceae bacterium]
MKVLVVEDHRDTNDMLCRLLTREGYDTVSAYSGEAALELIGAERPELVILDNMMPGMNGIEALRAIRETPDVARTPVIMYSAVADPAFREHAMQRGANAYFVKGSMQFSDLLKMMGRLLAA